MSDDAGVRVETAFGPAVRLAQDAEPQPDAPDGLDVEAFTGAGPILVNRKTGARFLVEPPNITFRE